ncbi:hypothetical protein [Telluribacter humicola]|uniref:hypothetical protein n=1 Tax=Telluribacter humicola TaxID=1720261 RepID=UPI001A970BE2|nr:hypothetical protein [Telluribacter humicola]
MKQEAQEHQQSDKFTVTIFPQSSWTEQTLVKVNKPFPIAIKIRNISLEPIWIVGVLDGSEVGVRFPRYIPKIEGPGYQQLIPEWPEMTAPIRASDFIELQPGESFDPTQPASGRAYLPLIAFRDFTPTTTGTYRISLTLSTDSANEKGWLGSLPNFDKAPVSSYIYKVPHITVISNLLTFTVL